MIWKHGRRRIKKKITKWIKNHVLFLLCAIILVASTIYKISSDPYLTLDSDDDKTVSPGTRRYQQFNEIFTNIQNPVSSSKLALKETPLGVSLLFSEGAFPYEPLATFPNSTLISSSSSTLPFSKELLEKFSLSDMEILAVYLLWQYKSQSGSKAPLQHLLNHYLYSSNHLETNNSLFPIVNDENLAVIIKDTSIEQIIKNARTFIRHLRRFFFENPIQEYEIPSEIEIQWTYELLMRYKIDLYGTTSSKIGDDNNMQSLLHLSPWSHYQNIFAHTTQEHIKSILKEYEGQSDTLLIIRLEKEWRTIEKNILKKNSVFFIPLFFIRPIKNTFTFAKNKISIPIITQNQQGVTLSTNVNASKNQELFLPLLPITDAEIYIYWGLSMKGSYCIRFLVTLDNWRQKLSIGQQYLMIKFNCAPSFYVLIMEIEKKMDVSPNFLSCLRLYHFFISTSTKDMKKIFDRTVTSTQLQSSSFPRQYKTTEIIESAPIDTTLRNGTATKENMETAGTIYNVSLPRSVNIPLFDPQSNLGKKSVFAKTNKYYSCPKLMGFSESKNDICHLKDVPNIPSTLYEKLKGLWLHIKPFSSHPLWIRTIRRRDHSLIISHGCDTKKTNCYDDSSFNSLAKKSESSQSSSQPTTSMPLPFQLSSSFSAFQLENNIRLNDISLPLNETTENVISEALNDKNETSLLEETFSFNVSFPSITPLLKPLVELEGESIAASLYSNSNTSTTERLPSPVSFQESSSSLLAPSLPVNSSTDNASYNSIAINEKSSPQSEFLMQFSCADELSLDIQDNDLKLSPLSSCILDQLHWFDNWPETGSISVANELESLYHGAKIVKQQLSNILQHNDIINQQYSNQKIKNIPLIKLRDLEIKLLSQLLSHLVHLQTSFKENPTILFSLFT